jgi:hypothetical protein
MSPSASPNRMKLLSAMRALVGAAIFAGGLLVAGTFTSAAPAAPEEECLPVLGCVTTTLPSVPLPPVTTPALPTTTTTATTPDPGGSTTQSAPPAGGIGTPGSPKSTQPQTVFSARAGVRVRGRGAARVVEIRLSLSKPARVSVLLSRSGSALARRQFEARAGASLLRLPLGRAVKPGLASLVLAYRSHAGESHRSSYRVRLPR